MVRATSDKQLSRTLQGFFKDKLQFSRTKIYLINRHSLPPLIILLAKHVLESFTIFTTSVILITLFLLYHFPQQDFAKWLGMTCNCIWGTEIAFETKKQKYNIVHSQKCFYVTGEFYRFLPRGWAKVSTAKNSNFTEKGVRCRQGCEC